MDQICITIPTSYAGVAASVVIGAQLIANGVASPETIQNPVGRILSRLLHFVALDIVTAKKKEGE